MAVAETVAVDGAFHPKELGENFERAYSRQLALGLVPDRVADWFDAVATSRIDPRGALPFYGTCLLAKGTLVEIKVAQKWVGTGEHRSRGRWMIKRDAHQRLLEAGGVYLLGIHQETAHRGEHEIVRQAIIPASLLDEHLEDRWFDAPAARSENEIAQLGWAHVLQPEVTRDGE